MSKSLKTLVLLLVLAAFIPAAARAQSAPSLGAAGDFAVLAGTAATCTDSTITGDVGVSPGGVITQTNCTVNGTTHVGDAAAQQAYNDFLVAYAALASEPCTVDMLTTLGGQTLAPGVYCFEAAATETGGVLTLDGPATGIWIFKIGTSGTGSLTGTNFDVVMAGGGQACNVTWWVAEAATLTQSNFLGTILAGTAITVTSGTFGGNALATTDVTITGSTVTVEEQQQLADLEAAVSALAGPPGTPLADKIEDALVGLGTARAELAKQPPDRQAALGALEGAAGDIEAAVKDGLLGATQATPILDQLAAVARLLAVTAIAEASAGGGDPATIAQAEQALAAGDGKRSTGAYKDAISRYKDALAKAESA